MADIWLSYSTEDLAHIILACSVHHVVKLDSTVPGTQIPWRTLTRNALVFPYLDGCYVFPYGIVWNAKVTSPGRATKKAVEDRCRELVPNLEIQDMFVSYDRLCAHDLYKLGLAYESLFVSSLAVKYYLQLVQFGCADVCLSDIYDLDDEESVGKTLMSDLIVNFSDGISIPVVEKSTEYPEHAITHHKLIHNAHYDIIIPAKINNNQCYVPVSAKCSFRLSSKAVMEKQLNTSRSRNQLLLWLYLGEGVSLEGNYPDVLFVDGSGCCN
ncbi:hypothetical protein HDU84_001229, partial [Entophlyctis sp. JEL0112]